MWHEIFNKPIPDIFAGSRDIFRLDEYGNLLTEINNNKVNNFIKCYPVPVKQYLNIDVSGKCPEELQLQIFNLSGIKVFAEEISIKGFNNNIIIDFTGFSDGIYFLNVSGNEFLFTRKIILSGGRK